jgi:alkylhydroperoxidase family enzyme
MPWSSECVLLAERRPHLVQEVKQKLGMVPQVFYHVGSLPWVVGGFIGVFAYGTQHLKYISREFKDIIHLVNAHETSCRYCYGMARMMMKLNGLSDDKIAKLEQNMYMFERDGWEKRATALLRNLSRMNPRVGIEDVRELEAAGMSREAVKEMVFYSSMNLFVKRFTIPLAIQPDNMEGMVSSPIFKFVRPFIGYMANKTMRKVRTSFQAISNKGPFAAILEPLNDLPEAQHILRSMIDDAWDSTVLPRRTKALILAVVGRTLECRFTVDEAARLLENEGYPRDKLDKVLTYLHSDDLDPFDNKVINFARGTARMQPEQIQKQCREFSAGLSSEELLEVLGVAAIANLMARLSVLMEKS